MEKKYYRTPTGYSTVEIPISEQQRLIRKMKAGIRKARKGHSSEFFFCAYADLSMHNGQVTEIICYSDLINNIDEEQDRRNQLYVELPFTRKRDFEKAKKMFLEYAESKYGKIQIDLSSDNFIASSRFRD